MSAWSEGYAAAVRELVIPRDLMIRRASDVLEGEAVPCEGDGEAMQLREELSGFIRGSVRPVYEPSPDPDEHLAAYFEAHGGLEGFLSRTCGGTVRAASGTVRVPDDSTLRYRGMTLPVIGVFRHSWVNPLGTTYLVSLVGTQWAGENLETALHDGDVEDVRVRTEVAPAPAAP